MPLVSGQCRVFIVNLGRFYSALPDLWRVLSPAERKRADSFYFFRDAAMFVAVHGSLRHILAQILAVAPEMVVFTTLPGGKSALASGFPHRLKFNIAHSRAWGSVALALDYDVGVDIEDFRPLDHFLELASECLHPLEMQRLMLAEKQGEGLNTFYSIWTQKESILKSLGTGLYASMKKFMVPESSGDCYGWTQYALPFFSKKNVYISTFHTDFYHISVALVENIDSK